MKFLVTGGAGFIGSALIRHLIGHSDHSVINVDKLTYAGNLDSLQAALTSDRHLLEVADICDADAVKRIFREHQPDAVFHLAAESHVDRSIDRPAEFVATNVVGTLTLLEAALDYYRGLETSRRGSFRFLHISTDEVFGDLGPDDPAFNEASSYQPSSPYSASKAGSDHLVRAWHRTFGLPILISNCSNNYGPCQFPEKLIPLMIISAINGRELPVYGDGMQIRDWLFVDDHARALTQIMTQGQPGESYNIGGNSERTNIRVVEAICDLLETFAPDKPQGLKQYRDLITRVQDRPGHDRRYAVDGSKIARTLGWTPQENFESGLAATVRWYLDNETWWQRVQDGSYLQWRQQVSGGSHVA